MIFDSSLIPLLLQQIFLLPPEGLSPISIERWVDCQLKDPLHKVLLRSILHARESEWNQMKDKKDAENKKRKFKQNREEQKRFKSHRAIIRLSKSWVFSQRIERWSDELNNIWDLAQRSMKLSEILYFDYPSKVRGYLFTSAWRDRQNAKTKRW